MVGEITDKVVARTIRLLPASEREDSNLGVAVRGTPVARPADAAVGGALTVTRHAVEQREVLLVPASSGAPLQARSSDGVSALSNPVPDLSEPKVARAQPSSSLKWKATIIQVVKELTVLFLVVTCLWRWHKLWNRQRNHTPPVEEHDESLVPKRQRGRPATLLANSGITRIRSWLSRLRRTKLQIFVEMSTEKHRTLFLYVS